MVKRQLAKRIRKTHRYLGIFIGLQFLAWTVSGLYFSWTDIDEIHGDQFRKSSSSNNIYYNLIPLDSIPHIIQQIVLVNIEERPYYWVNNKFLYDARSGLIKNKISKKEALRIAKDNLIDDLEVDYVEYLTLVDPHHEFRAQSLPAYAIHYLHPDKLVAYVDARSGIFKRVRHNSWRWFDFLWMGHTMDYQGRDNFNNLLLRIFSLFGIFTVVSGFILWGTSSPTLKKIFRYNG